MSSRLALLLLVACAAPKPQPPTPPDTTVAPPVSCGTHCGTERWAVKTLTDADAGLVDLTPQITTIAALRALPAPPTLPADNRVIPTEVTTFRITATLVAWKLEGDEDLHLILSDDNGQTMIAEIPSSACTMVCYSPVRSWIDSARATVIGELGQPSSTGFLTVNRTVVITGVGFFDFPHGQRGAAPNQIELHPVIGVVFP